MALDHWRPLYFDFMKKLNVKSGFYCAALIVLLALACLPVFAEADFFKVVLSNFDSWDQNHNGHLTIDDIDHALLDPSNRGLAACALSVLHVNHKKADDVQQSGYTKEWLTSMSQSQKGADYQKRFDEAEVKLSESVPQLFSPQAPRLTSMHQGRVGDCYLISTIGALVNARPDAVRGLISCDKDGRYTVSFFGEPPVTIDAPTDGELVTFGQSDDDGIWLNVLEKAYATLKLDLNPDEDDDELYQGICGGRSGGVIRLLTGHAAQRLSFKRPAARARAREMVLRALQQKRIVTTSVSFRGPDGRSHGHALAVVAMDPGSDTVTIWNPWGTTAMYKTVGVMMTNGEFTVPIDYWLNRFRSCVIEE